MWVVVETNDVHGGLGNPHILSGGLHCVLGEDCMVLGMLCTFQRKFYLLSRGVRIVFLT